MAKGHAGNQHTNPGTFLGAEEALRGRLPGGRLHMPKPKFVQPENGAGPGTGDVAERLTAEVNPTTKGFMKSGNREDDLSGGLYGS